MQAMVTASVTPPARNSFWSAGVSPQAPGRRRPHTGHSEASARVSRPHDGQTMVRVGLPNMRLVGGRERLACDAVALVEPHAEVEEAARQRAERTVRVGRPGRPLLTGGAAPATARRRRVRTVREQSPAPRWDARRKASYSARTKPVNSRTSIDTSRRVTLESATIDVVRES